MLRGIPDSRHKLSSETGACSVRPLLRDIMVMAGASWRVSVCIPSTATKENIVTLLRADQY